MISLKLGSTVHLHFYPQTITVIAGQTESARRWPIPAFAQAPPLGIDANRKCTFERTLRFLAKPLWKISMLSDDYIWGVWFPEAPPRRCNLISRGCVVFGQHHGSYNAGFLLKPFFHDLHLTRSKCNQDFSPLFVKRFFLLIWSNSWKVCKIKLWDRKK